MVQLEFISSQWTFVMWIKCGNDTGSFFNTSKTQGPEFVLPEWSGF